MSFGTKIAETFRQVADDQGKTLRAIGPDLLLLNCGLDSLCFAIIVAKLEDELGLDPFSSAEEFNFPSTFGEFVDCYDRVGA